MADLKQRLKKVVERKKVLQFLRFPDMYSASMNHLMNENLKKGFPIQFYYPYRETFLAIEEIPEVVGKDLNELKILKDAEIRKSIASFMDDVKQIIKNKDVGEHEIDNYPDEEKGFEVNYLRFTIRLVKDGDYIGTSPQMTEEMYNVFPNVKKLRVSLVNLVDEMFSILEELEKKPTTPVRPSEPVRIVEEAKQNYQEAIKTQVKEYYEKFSRGEILTNLKTFIQTFLTDKKFSEKAFGIRSGGHLPRPSGVAKSKEINKEMKLVNETDGIESTIYLQVTERNTFFGSENNVKKSMIETYKMKKEDIDKAKSFEIEESFTVFNDLIFGEDESISFDIKGKTYKLYRLDKGKTTKTSIVKKQDERKLEVKLKDASEILATEIMAPVNIGNKNAEETKKIVELLSAKSKTYAGTPKTKLVSEVLSEVSKEVNKNIQNITAEKDIKQKSTPSSKTIVKLVTPESEDEFSDDD